MPRSRTRIHQFHAVLAPASAVSNEVIALHRMLGIAGYGPRVFAETGSNLAGVTVESWTADAADCDLLLVHYSRDSTLHDAVFSCACPKAMLFHDVTPPSYFAAVDSTHRELAERGLDSLPRYAPATAAAAAHSEFSAHTLSRAGYRDPAVLPYLLDDSLYELAPDPAVLGLHAGHRFRLLAVGRVAPNKCLEDCLFVLDYLQKFENPRWGLTIAGSHRGLESYRLKLETLCADLRLQNVAFTGGISQDQLLAYYRVSGALLWMSEHEGFGVPLVEAMRLDLPVFAFAAGATPEVLGQSGVLFPEKDWTAVAEAIARTTRDTGLRERILEGQRARYRALAPAAVRPQWSTWVDEVLSGVR